MSRFLFRICLALLVPVSVAAQPQEEVTRYGLRGVHAVYVVIQDLQEDLVKDGLLTETLRSELKELIQAGGLEVFVVEDPLDEALVQGTVRLAIQATTVSATNRVYCVQIEFRQRVNLTRDPSLGLVATTWQASDIGLSPLKDMLEIRGAIRDLMAKFLADCQTANPEPLKKTETDN